MTSFIKNQILKHLTKFTKNLSPEKIKINAFKGEGDVSNLEFDESKLTDLLELPNWLRIKHAACNKVSIKVQWTMIKKEPILLVLDEVFVVVEALQVPRPPKNPNDQPSYRPNPNSYGFIDRVIDGMKIKINAVKIIFSASTFKASIELTRLVVLSRMPNWAESDHLKKTRIKSVSHGVVLLFKEIEWDSTRIEANALQDCQATPLKLITNSTKVRLTMKKSLSDCSIVESKVEFILNDLFWILTISQIKAMIIFMESLREIIHQSNELNKQAAKKRLEQQSNPNSPQSIKLKLDNMAYNMAPPDLQLARAKLFAKYDIKETSYHAFVSRVEFHFCEEGEEGSQLSKNSVVDGSVRLLIVNCQIDLYPYHLSSMTRDHFYNEKDVSKTRDLWVESVYASNSVSENCHYRQLMESVTIVRFNDITMNCVSTATKTNNEIFIGSDISRLKLPQQTTTFFLDITDHYWKSGSDRNLPETMIFCQTNPLYFNLDWQTVLWLNAFFQNLKKELVASEPTSDFIRPQESPNDQQKPAIHIEAIMSRVVLASNFAAEGQPDRPTKLQMQIGSLSIDNTFDNNSNHDNIFSLIEDYQKLSFFNNSTTFPFLSKDPKLNFKQFSKLISTNLKNATEKSLWKFYCNSFWIDYEDAKAYGNRPRSCLDPINITLWLNLPSESCKDFIILSKLPDRMEIKMDHYQLLFLYRIIDHVTSSITLFQQDRKSIGPQTQTSVIDEFGVIFLSNIETFILKMEWPISQTKAESVTDCCSSPIQMKDKINSEDCSEKSEPPPHLPTVVLQEDCPATEILSIDQNYFGYKHSFRPNQNNPLVDSKRASPIFNVLNTFEQRPTQIFNGLPGLKRNRRSFTSLTSVGNTPVVEIPSSAVASGLINCKSVKNLFSVGRLSRKESQISLNNLADADRTSVDSDTSDWISDALLNDLEIGEDILNESMNGVIYAGDDVVITNSNSQAMVNFVQLTLSDLRLFVSSKDIVTVCIGVFGELDFIESNRQHSDNRPETNKVNSSQSNPKILSRIESSSQLDISQFSIDLRFVESAKYTLLRSSLACFGEIFEDEIPLSKLYTDNSFPPKINIHFLSTVSIELIEDRPCANLSCPNEHASLILNFPSGMYCTVEGTTILSFAFNQTLDRTCRDCKMCRRCAQKMSEISNHSENIINPEGNASDSDGRFNFNDIKKSSDTDKISLLNEIQRLQEKHRISQIEISKLKDSLRRTVDERNALFNLIHSPSTTFI